MFVDQSLHRGSMADRVENSPLVGLSDTAYRKMVTQDYRHVLGLAWRMLAVRAEAEDVTQEAFLRLWNERKHIEPDGAKFWLRKVARHLCLDRLRKRKDWNISFDETLEDSETGLEAPILNPEQETIGREIGAQINQTLEKLPSRQRVALTLVLYDELPARLAASELGLSVEALESLLARARRTLRQSLSSLHKDPV